MMCLFKMSDHDLHRSYSRIQVKKAKDEVLLCQRSFALKIVKEFSMSKSNLALAPLEVKFKFSGNDEGNLIDYPQYKRHIGSLRYLTHR